jgi:hypothetical protein
MVGPPANWWQLVGRTSRPGVIVFPVLRIAVPMMLHFLQWEFAGLASLERLASFQSSAFVQCAVRQRKRMPLRVSFDTNNYASAGNRDGQLVAECHSGLVFL